MSDVLRILLVGDPEVGKSSIISTYTSRHFPDDGVPSIIYDSKLPPDATANGTFVVIMDSNARSSNNKANSTLTDKILIADSIVCVYDVTRPETLESIANEWLPLIKDVISSANQSNMYGGGFGGVAHNSSPGTGTSENVRSLPSVIVAGNKTDLLNDLSEDMRAEEESELKYFSSLLSEFSFVKYCCRCSAKLLDVDSVFYYAENVITFPIDPLYNVTTSDFTAQAVGAFKRIFRLFDEDGDGTLSDSEIAALQLRCFQIEFANDEILALKKHIIKDVPGGLVHNKITFPGFLGMIRKFIEKRSNLETAWIILRKCGYENSSNLALEMPPDILSVALPSDACTVDEVSAWRRLVSRLRSPMAAPSTMPAIEDTNSGINESLSTFNAELQHQLSTLQEVLQYDSTGLSRDAIQFLVSLSLVTEESTRNRFRVEVATAAANSAVAGSGSAYSPRIELLSGVLQRIGWNELSQESIDEIFSVLPHASCVYPAKPTPATGTTTGSWDGPVSHPWSSPPLFTPDQAASSAHVVYCFAGYYSYVLTSDLSPEIMVLSRDISNTSTVSSNMGSSSPVEPIKPIKPLSLTYTTVTMWLAHWQLLAMYEPALVQKLLFALGFVEKSDGPLRSHYGIVSYRSYDRYLKGFQQLRTVNTVVHSYPSRSQQQRGDSSNTAGDGTASGAAASHADQGTRAAMQFVSELNRSAGCCADVCGAMAVDDQDQDQETDRTRDEGVAAGVVTCSAIDAAAAVMHAVGDSGEACTVRFCNIDVPGLLAALPSFAPVSTTNTRDIVHFLYSAVVTTYSLCLSVSDFYAASIEQELIRRRYDLHLLLYDNSSNSGMSRCLEASQGSQSVVSDDVPYVATLNGRGNIGVANPPLELTTPRLFVMLPSRASVPSASAGASASASGNGEGSVEGSDEAIIITRHKLQEHIANCSFHPTVELELKQQQQQQQRQGAMAGVRKPLCVSFAPLHKAVYRLTCTSSALESVSVSARKSLHAQYLVKNSFLSSLRRMLSGEPGSGGGGLSLGALGVMGFGLFCSAASATSVWYYVQHFTLKRPHPVLGGRTASDSTAGLAVAAQVTAVADILRSMVLHDCALMYAMLVGFADGAYKHMLGALASILPREKWTLGGMYQHVYGMVVATTK